MQEIKLKKNEIEKRSQNLNDIIKNIKKCLDILYSTNGDHILFERNKGRGSCERCIVFRFAHYLQKNYPDYFVDCDYNSSIINGILTSGKIIDDPDGGKTKRFIDIIVHKRSNEGYTDFICFEIKKWNNYSKDSSLKDENNLKILTKDYGYKYGFHLILGKTKQDTKITVWKDGEKKEESISLFKNETKKQI